MSHPVSPSTALSDLTSVTVTQMSLEFGDDVTETEWVDVGRRLGQITNAVGWWVGDWWRAAITYGAGPDLAEQVGLNYQTCRKLASVAGRFELFRRRNNLSISHHIEVAALDPAEADQLLDEAETKELSVHRLRRRVADLQAQKAFDARPTLQDEHTDNIHHGNSFELASQMIPDDSVALIFTDPPYDRESLPMFSELAELAERVLVDGGTLITYCGQYVLPEVIERVTPNGIRFFWMNSCLHTGATAQMREYGIKVKWKPMLWFVKGDFRRDRTTWVDDLVESRQEKDAHPWQQSVIEAAYYIDKLTRPGELVVDPFCGGGTTAIAAKQTGRQWWTADIAAEAVATARARIAAA